jgi:hypothetical protein
MELTTATAMNKPRKIFFITSPVAFPDIFTF